ncbi:MAG: SRPBCC family protein [Leptospiraceae bacterium]|nr:SRPBCC family protein [Leptospiraceae bacterium]MCB1201715.1 SRPBCC family protein [Leptospiraceae bacterium]
MAFQYDESLGLEIHAPARTVFEHMIDFESYPEWQTSVAAARKMKNDIHGPVIEFEIDLVLKKIRYVLGYKVDHERMHLTWDYLDGDIEHVAGEFFVQEKDSEVSWAVYRLDVRPGFWLPGPLANFVKNTAMRGVLHDLQRKVGKK